VAAGVVRDVSREANPGMSANDDDQRVLHVGISLLVLVLVEAAAIAFSGWDGGARWQLLIPVVLLAALWLVLALRAWRRQ
jgi:hypothetical protein